MLKRDVLLRALVAFLIAIMGGIGVALHGGPEWAIFMTLWLTATIVFHGYQLGKIDEQKAND